MKDQKNSTTDEFWTTPPYSNPLNRIRSMMTSLDKELAELYRKKSLQLAEKITPSTSSSNPEKLNPIINVTRSTSVKSSTSARTSNKSKLGASKVSLPPYQTTPVGFSFERFKRYKNIAMRAYQGKKIFTIYGCYPKIRQALVKRGWVEKVPPNYYKLLQAMSQHSLLKNAKDGNDYELVAISKMLEKYPTYFIWQPKGFKDGFGHALPYRNRIRRAREFDFTTKEGLLGCIENVHFYTSAGVSQARAPRCHRLAFRDEVAEFQKDFRQTFCRSLLLFINEFETTKPIADLESGTIPLTVVNFAIDRIKESIQVKEHEDINIPTGKELCIDEEEWQTFLTRANKIITEVEKIKADSIEFAKIMVDVKKVLAEAKLYFPMMESDGYNNIWILKPAYCCRGSGIVLMKEYEGIMTFANRRLKMRYVAQKYIERPLLIYKTKFDIRQYIIVTINENVNIWIYNECYLKFSSQEFDLKDFRECVHLTNNTVQKKYKNGKRSDKLPQHNMWSLAQFQSYLTSIGKSNIWSNTIYPGMKENAIAVVLASLEETDLIVNNFEMYGCDFMLDEEFNPILIEINATPDMSASTCVTAKICPAALEDLVKVVVDVPRNPRASTGGFELIFKLPCAKVAGYQNNLTIQGNKINLVSSTPEPTSTGPIAGISKLLKKSRFLTPKKKLPKVITEKDVKDGKEVKEDQKDKIKNNEKQEQTSSKRRKRGGGVKPNRKTGKKSGGASSTTGKSQKKAAAQKKVPACGVSANTILQKSVEILNTLKSSHDELIGQKVKSVMSGMSNPHGKTAKLSKSQKTPGRLSAGGCLTKLSLTSDAKEFLALKAANCAKGKKEEKILLDFMDIVLKKLVQNK